MKDFIDSVKKLAKKCRTEIDDRVFYVLRDCIKDKMLEEAKNGRLSGKLVINDAELDSNFTNSVWVRLKECFDGVALGSSSGCGITIIEFVIEEDNEHSMPIRWDE